MPHDSVSVNTICPYIYPFLEGLLIDDIWLLAVVPDCSVCLDICCYVSFFFSDSIDLFHLLHFFLIGCESVCLFLLVFPTPTLNHGIVGDWLYGDIASASACDPNIL